MNPSYEMIQARRHYRALEASRQALLQAEWKADEISMARDHLAAKTPAERAALEAEWMGDTQ